MSTAAKSAEPSTWVFQSDMPRGECGPLALGCGPTIDSARQDALTRLQARYSRGEIAASPELTALAQSLYMGKAVIRVTRRGFYPSQMGHDYMSHETQEVAVVLSSDSAVHAAIREKGLHTGVQLQAEYGQSIQRLVGHPVDSAFVDWDEVRRDFDVEVPAQAQVQTLLAGGQPVLEPQELPQTAGKRIADDVIEILGRCTVEDNMVRLPPIRLAPALYKRVDEVLRALGGKWVGRKTQAHVFEESPASVLDVAIGTRSFTRPQDFGYFPTPDDLAERVIRLAQIEPGMKVLEPSAGQGALALRAVEAVGGNFDLVTVVELLPGNARALREAGFSAVNQVDFLTLDPVPIFDRVVLNPPFSNQADIDHVMHASRFLKPDGRIVAITSPSWELRTNSRKADAFKEFVEMSLGEVQSVDAGAFKSSGTDVASRIVSMDAFNFPWNVERDGEIGSERRERSVA